MTSTDWPTAPLSSLVEPDRGISYGVVQPGSHVEDGVPIVRVGDVRNGVISTADPLRVSLAVEALHSRTRLRGGELLMTLVGTVGETAIAPSELAGWNVARAVGVIPVRNDVGPRWVRYVLESPDVRAKVSTKLNTTVQATLNLRDVGLLPISMPPRPLRRAITSILGAIDDKIELNRRINKTLEQMARSLFRDWFLDFGPVRAKLEGREPYLSTDNWHLFPDAVQADGHPSGWNAATLSELASLNPENWSNRLPPASIEYVDLASTKWGTIEATTPLAWQEAPSRAQRILRRGDTIVGVVRPGNGSYACVDAEGLTASTGFAVLRPHKDSAAELVYLAATNAENIDRLAHIADGAAYPAVRPEAVWKTPIALAPATVVDAFHTHVAPTFEAIASNKREIATLNNLRNTLLPSLLSGDTRIKDAERFVDEATA